MTDTLPTPPDDRSVSYDDDIWRSKEDVYDADPTTPQHPYATEAHDGKPGYWMPQGSLPPDTLRGLRHSQPVYVTPVPDTPWDGWIESYDGQGRPKWGTTWVGTGWMAVPI